MRLVFRKKLNRVSNVTDAQGVLKVGSLDEAVFLHPITLGHVVAEALTQEGSASITESVDVMGTAELEVVKFLRPWSIDVTVIEKVT